MLRQRFHLDDIFNHPTGSLTKHIHSHYMSIFRELLIGGILFLLAGLLIFQPFFQRFEHNTEGILGKHLLQFAYVLHRGDLLAYNRVLK